jgi:hypothetical protein
LVVGTVVGMDGSELLASRDVPYGNRPPWACNEDRAIKASMMDSLKEVGLWPWIHGHFGGENWGRRTLSQPPPRKLHPFSLTGQCWTWQEVHAKEWKSLWAIQAPNTTNTCFGVWLPIACWRV